MAEELCEAFYRYISWSYSIGFSDHNAMVMEIDFDSSMVKYPFKFNPIWLEDQSFEAFVKEQWRSLSRSHYPSVMFGLVSKLGKLKIEVQKWEKYKKIEP